jgi:hypothetical protein
MEFQFTPEYELRIIISLSQKYYTVGGVFSTLPLVIINRFYNINEGLAPHSAHCHAMVTIDDTDLIFSLLI